MAMPSETTQLEIVDAHISRAFNDLTWATTAVDLSADQLRARIAGALAELNEAARHLHGAA